MPAVGGVASDDESQGAGGDTMRPSPPSRERLAVLPSDDLSAAGVPLPFARLGLTFDDVLLQPSESDIIPSEVTTTSRVSKRITVRIPLEIGRASCRERV